MDHTCTCTCIMIWRFAGVSHEHIAYILYIRVALLGEAGSDGGIFPKMGEIVGVIVRVIGAAVAMLCMMVTLITSVPSVPSSLISINPNVTTA